MKLKKLTCLLLCGALSFALLAGCSGGKEPEPEPEEPVVTSPEATELESCAALLNAALAEQAVDGMDVLSVAEDAAFTLAARELVDECIADPASLGLVDPGTGGSDSAANTLRAKLGDATNTSVSYRVWVHTEALDTALSTDDIQKLIVQSAASDIISQQKNQNLKPQCAYISYVAGDEELMWIVCAKLSRE